MSVRTPSYRLHRPTGQAVVTLGGRDHYLGKHGTPESEEAYRRLLAEWLARGRASSPPAARPGGCTVDEVVLSFWRHAEGYYRRPDGSPSPELANLKVALKPLRKLYGPTPAAEFGPVALKAVRQGMVDAGLCRRTINQGVNRMIRVFRHAVEAELVPADVHLRLKAVEGLRKGRSGAREGKKVRPVADAHVDALRPHVSRQAWALVELQRLTGMRSGEATIMRSGDVDRSGPVWVYTPSTHKGDHRDQERRIFVGPRAQAVLTPWLRADPEAYLFQPCEALAERSAARRLGRKTPMTPSQRKRARKKRPKRTPGDRYTPCSYLRAVVQACDRAGVPRWHPHQLRHSSTTRLRAEIGLDVARIVLGHTSSAVTETYAEVDRDKAVEVMGKVG